MAIIPQCDAKHDMHLIHSMQPGKTVCTGFYCPECKKFYKAIGRERQLPIPKERRT